MDNINWNQMQQMMSHRELVTDNRCAGRLVEWMGTHGFIEPTSTIRHPMAAMNGGKIWVSADDVSGPPPEPGGEVSFLVFCDMNGLGAMECRSGSVGAAGSGGAITMAGGSPLLGAGPILSSFAKKNGMRTRIIAKRVVGKVIEWDGKEGWIEPSEEIENPESREDIKLV